MIGVLIDGRMGNQLFQYAFALNFAKKHNTFFFVHQRQIRYKFILPRYFKLHGYNRFLNSFKTRLYNSILKKKFKILDLKDNYDKPQVNINKIHNYHYLEGYFQSELYFFERKKDILKTFQIKNKYKKKFRKKYSQLFNNNKTIAIHIRRTDYLVQGDESLFGIKDLSLPIEYYNNCLHNIKNIDGYKVIFISDDMEYVKKNFGEEKNYYFEQNEEIIDFQLIMNADIAIIANSSFSWWAAYLNAKPNKIIYAPKYWFGFKINKEIPHSIIPNSWIKLESN